MTQPEKYLLLLEAGCLTFIFGCEANSLPLPSTFLGLMDSVLVMESKNAVKPKSEEHEGMNWHLTMCLSHILQHLWFYYT